MISPLQVGKSLCRNNEAAPAVCSGEIPAVLTKSTCSSSCRCTELLAVLQFCGVFRATRTVTVCRPCWKPPEEQTTVWQRLPSPGCKKPVWRLRTTVSSPAWLLVGCSLSTFRSSQVTSDTGNSSLHITRPCTCIASIRQCFQPWRSWNGMAC